MSDTRRTITSIANETTAATLILQMVRDDIHDEQLEHDTIEGETSLIEAIDLGVDRLAELDAMCAALKAREDNFAARRKRFGVQQASIKAAIAMALRNTDQRKIELPAATVYISNGKPKAVVTDEDLLPPEYFAAPKPKPSLTDIKTALEQGLDIPGAELTPATTILNIRTR